MGKHSNYLGGQKHEKKSHKIFLSNYVFKYRIIGGHFIFATQDTPQTIVADKLSDMGQLLKIDAAIFATQPTNKKQETQTNSDNSAKIVAVTTLESTLNSVIEQSDQSLAKVQEIANDI